MTTDINNASTLALPAEWATQESVMLTWPHADSDWQPWLEKVIPVFQEIASTIAKHQKVIIAVNDEQMLKQVKSLFPQEDNIQVFVVGNNDTWARDHGPICRYRTDKNGTYREVLDFQFNAWGNKFAYDLDNQISQKLHQQQAFGDSVLIKQSLILEGGSIESDGLGTLLTTSQCLLNKNRNPDLSRDEIEQVLKQELGIEKILWLDHGDLEGDDTDAHIDTIARLCTPTDIAYCTANQDDEHFEELNKMEQQLASFTNHNGQIYNLHALPIPSAILSEDGDRLPATYANFLIINGAVLLPIYGDKNDQVAIDQLEKIFPDRIIYPIDCRYIIEQYGSLHCLTMQIPAIPE